ncbi:MAG: TonB-dependent receptor, partial [Acidobacteriota bacterium]
AAFNYRDIEGIGINTGFNQLNGRLNLSQKALDDRLTLGLNVSATEKRSQLGFNQAFYYASIYNPTAPARWEDAAAGDYNADLDTKYGGYFQQENFDYFNPLAIAEQNINDATLKDLLVNVRGDFEIVDGLTYSLSYSQQKESDLFAEWYPSTSYFRGFNEKGFASRRTEDRSTELTETTLRYDMDFGNSSSLTLLGGYSYQEFTNESFQAQATRFITNDLNFNNLNFGQRAALGDPNAVFSGKDRYKVIGFFGRANVNIDDTYFLMASVRREGSTRFGAENQWGIFPAVSAGVDITKLADIGGVDQLKLRVAYGITGSLPPFSYLSQFLYSRQGNFYYNGAYTPAIGPTRNANPDLKWEQKGEFDAGLDFALMDYKLTGSLDFYNRKTNDLIYPVRVPQPPNFANTTWANLEDVALQSRGVELSLGYNYAKDAGFSWEPRVTFATYKTTLELEDAADATFKFFQGTDPVTYDFSTSPGAPGQNDDPTIGVFGGQELGQIVGPVYEGVADDGNWKFKDVNGDGLIETGLGQADRAVIGNGLPDFSLGLQNSFRFNKFDFSFFLRGDFGHDLVNMYRNFYETL